jgi:hypothetical protein
MLAGGMAAALLLAAARRWCARRGAATLLRLATGAASAASFVGGGLLAARLAGAAGAAPAWCWAVLRRHRAGHRGSALMVPPAATGRRPGPGPGWRWGRLAAIAGLDGAGTRSCTHPPRRAAVPHRAGAASPSALAGYLMFGLGYIGYMTFVITLLREQGLRKGTSPPSTRCSGLGVVASSWLWAGLLQRWRGGLPLALLNGLLALATVLPVLSAQPVAVFASGALFGSVFLSVVASTTALVRHNLPAAAWPAGIAAFTIVFAAGRSSAPAWWAGWPTAAAAWCAGLAVQRRAAGAGGGAGVACQRALAARSLRRQDPATTAAIASTEGLIQAPSSSASAAPLLGFRPAGHEAESACSAAARAARLPQPMTCSRHSSGSA